MAITTEKENRAKEKREKKQSYYLKEFKKIDEGKMSWNWAACFFVSGWAIYRKMYFEAVVIFSICSLCSFLCFFIGSFLVKDSLATYGMSQELLKALQYLNLMQKAEFLVPCLIFGAFANKLYYNNLKKKVNDGYNLFKNYKTTDVACVVSTCIVALILIVLSLGVLVAFVAINKPSLDEIMDLTGFQIGVSGLCSIAISSPICYLFWRKDKKAVKAALKDNPNYDREINEENIKKLI